MAWHHYNIEKGDSCAKANYERLKSEDREGLPHGKISKVPDKSINKKDARYNLNL